ncbi:hypothetical protein JW766_03245 [Candidatus Dojkabacteria bacterium]|nr:hypothetical protein [Candidatus Dojkabacteria bacterium]
MAKVYDPKTCDLSFIKGSIYKDLREMGGNAYRDIKMSLSLGTSSDLIYYLRNYSDLLKGFDGNEHVELLNRGMFSCVYLVKDHNGGQIVVKRSHDGWMPLQVFENFHIPIPRWLVSIFFSDYGVTEISLKRDVYDYENVIKPYWGTGRVKIEDEKFSPFLNMALYMVDHFLPEFSSADVYTKKFWKKLLNRKRHKKLSALYKYLKSVRTEKHLIPEEERFILYDAFTKSLQTLFIQDAKIGKEDVLEDKKMAFPFEMIAEGTIPREMPKLMIEHLLRSIESFVNQLKSGVEVNKIPDMRPIDIWKVLPPTPYELYIAETNNLVVYKDNKGAIRISLVDTHLLLEPEANLFYRWTEKRFWVSMFLNLRFWVRKALEEK